MFGLFGDVFTNSSGHPVSGGKAFERRNRARQFENFDAKQVKKLSPSFDVDHKNGPPDGLP
jgi:hypothetical protein